MIGNELDIEAIRARAAANAASAPTGPDPLREMLDREATERLRRASFVPPRFATTRLADVRPRDGNERALESARLLIARGFIGSACYWGGDVGVGKTALGAAIVNEAILQHKSARMLTAVTLVDQLHDASKYGSHEEVGSIIASFARTPVLLLDDLGREAISRRSISWLFELLNRRWLAALPLVATSNLNFAALVDRYGDACARAGEDPSMAHAIADRLRGLIPLKDWVEVTGRSMR